MPKAVRYNHYGDIDGCDDVAQEIEHRAILRRRARARPLSEFLRGADEFLRRTVEDEAGHACAHRRRPPSREL